MYVAGQASSGTAWDADPSTNTNNITSVGGADIFLAKYDGTLMPASTSFFKWALCIGGLLLDDAANALAVNSSGKLYTTGYSVSGSFDADPSTNTHNTNTNNNNQDMIAIIYDGSLTPSSTSFYKAAVWLGNALTTPQINATAIDASGNVYAAGYFSGIITLGTTILKSNGSQDMFLAKYNSSGTLQWATSMGGTGLDQLNGIAVDGSGNVYVAGFAASSAWDADPSSNTNNMTPIGSNDMFIAKYDGTLTPSNTSFYKWAFLMGSSSTDQLNKITLDAGGNIYVAGYTNGSSWDANPSSNTNNVAISAGGSDMFVAKYDGTLTPSNTSFYKWAFTMGGISTDQLNAISTDASGNVYVAGVTQSSATWDADPSSNTNSIAATAGNNDMFVAKYDGTLVPTNTSFLKWAFKIGGTGNDNISGQGLAVDGSGNVYIGAFTQSSTAWDADPTSNTNTVAALATNADMFLAKYDGTTTPSNTAFYKWATVIGSTGSADQVNAISVDPGGNLFVAGITGSTSNWDADPSSNTNNVFSSGSVDMFLAKYDGSQTPSSTSFYQWAFTAGSATADQLNYIASRNGLIAVGGYFTNSSVDFQPGAGTSTIGSAQNGLAQSLFLGRYNDGFIWAGSSNSTWGTGGNWTGGNAPTSTDLAIIPTGLSTYPVLSSGTTSIGSINIASGASLTVNGGTLQIAGDITNAGTFNATGGTIELNGSSAQTITAGTLNVTNLIMNNSTGATISSGTVNVLGTYTPTSGTLTTGGFLTLKSTATGTARIAAGSTSGGYISGVVNTERYVPGKRAFRFLSHPFTTAQSMSALTDDIDITGSGGSPFTSTSTNNPSAFYFDVTAGDNSTTGNNPGWTAYTASSTWAQYQVMRVLVRGAKGEGLTAGSYTPSNNTLDMSGTVNQGDVNMSLTKGSGTDFVIVGNPFPSQVNMDALTLTNVGSSFYIWDANQGTRGAYTSYTFGSSSYNLPVCGAFVTTLSANGSIVFEEADKTNGTAGAPFKTTGIANQVELKLEDSTIFWDRLLLNFDDNAMATVDYPDAAKLYNPDMTFYTLSKDDSMLSIDTRPYVASETIKLGLYAGIKKDFKFTAPNVNMPAGTKLYFTDKLLSKTIEVTPSFEYWFTVDANTASWGNNRFELNTQGEPTSIKNVNASKLKVKLVPNPTTDNVTLYYEGAGKELNVIVTNMMGVKVAVAKAENVNGSILLPTTQLTNGIYNITIYNGAEVMTQKLIKQ